MGVVSAGERKSRRVRVTRTSIRGGEGLILEEEREVEEE